MYFATKSNASVYAVESHFSGMSARNVAWVKSALWRHLPRSTFTRSRPVARWSRWPACYETQLMWGLGDGNHSRIIVSLIFILHSSRTLVFAFKSETLSKCCRLTGTGHRRGLAAAGGGKHTYLNIIIYVNPFN